MARAIDRTPPDPVSLLSGFPRPWGSRYALCNAAQRGSKKDYCTYSQYPAQNVTLRAIVHSVKSLKLLLRKGCRGF